MLLPFSAIQLSKTSQVLAGNPEEGGERPAWSCVLTGEVSTAISKSRPSSELRLARSPYLVGLLRVSTGLCSGQEDGAATRQHSDGAGLVRQQCGSQGGRGSDPIRAWGHGAEDDAAAGEIPEPRLIGSRGGAVPRRFPSTVSAVCSNVPG